MLPRDILNPIYLAETQVFGFYQKKKFVILDKYENIMFVAF